MGPKYEFTDETMNYCGHLLHRIRRLEDGNLGGWIESEENLSQEGNCWVDENAKVYDRAQVYGSAKVYGNAKVYDEAKVYGNAKVFGYAEILYNAQIYGNAEVGDGTWVYNNAKVFDNAAVYDDAQVYDDAKVYGNAVVYDYAQVYGNAQVYDNAQIYGDAKVYGEAIVCGDAQICDKTKVCDEIIDEDTNNNEQPIKVVQDFIYKIDDSDKLNIKTEYSSIDEYFSSAYQNDAKLDILIIGTVDTKISLIKIEKVEVESKTEFKFIVDITNEEGSNFSFKSVIKDAEQLNSLVTQTIEALNAYPDFTKYTDDLADCL